MPAFHRLLLTGAAGGLGRVLRPRLKAYCAQLRLSDRADLGTAAAGEELCPAVLEDKDAVHALLQDVDAVVHFGGISVEAAWQPILQANIIGLYHLYEAARHQRVRRIVFASSNHVTGFYRQDDVITPQAPPRPDTLYGVSKAFGENLSRMYHDRYGIETVCIRIGSATPAPENRRMLATWLSHDDLERLIVAALTAHYVSHTVMFGLSDNTTRWWDNTSASHIGYRPMDSAEPFRAEIEAREPLADASDPIARYQGGVFVNLGPYDA
ncbi:MAG TPA: NAD(P)-dependent oxidoreductase [Aquabacterium sp.]|nr:NAD(P)-dependent oxidoreductase [Aquabacterium sp.]HSW07456.1 NAD(P)-dependent oxidoreductase [Aquabacterium sp.]